MKNVSERNLHQTWGYHFFFFGCWKYYHISFLKKKLITI